ncbi:MULTISPECIES: hypothetical protein [Streptomyces]|uniref:Uncharacterized protein n=1 Tax=Streptomyces fradiae ATCC 10745 = DSM 40063 TaxID=1319510 RepID=A0A1Y2NTT7_STRFR|nr:MULTISPECIES: hypothetical protein [Streptomyces]KAF0646742.1 hypothetical protein K701_27565 [Streptomyces fradiae ATCC 10745 = DSM 40063]OSY50631.1 hypothetical protein BG846_03799 [Streptomyces fradiae ATCC 10745 = DSM 40063]QEV11651.1 hypothetical protein CP974_06075 [Streptomyces fradiae ATCC 10745 = DSM 40063]
MTTCVACTRTLRDDETQTCRPCVTRVDQQLAELAGPEGLYASLTADLAPARTGSAGRVSGSRTAPIPVRLEALSLAARGGIVTILATWVDDWATYGHATPVPGGTLQQQLDAAVNTLRFNHQWAAAQHPAYSEFAHEIRRAWTACRTQTAGDPAPRRIPVQCPCGHTLRITLDTRGETCPSCHEHYSHSEVLQLPMAARNAA